MPLPPLVGPGDHVGSGEDVRSALPDGATGLTAEQVQRGSRHVMLPGFGLDGLARLANARVLVIGAGGLGSPVLHYLAGAGVGTIGIIDFDRVDLSNLQRQVIHTTASVGQLKTQSAATAIAAIDPAVRVVQHPVRLDGGNALELFAGYDLVVDGSDNFATRYLASDAAALSGIPYVWGSVLRFDGQVTVFWDAAPDGAGLDYRDLHPLPPDPGDVLSCDEAGVLGAACGIIGSMMAAEVVKLVTGVGEPLLGRVQPLYALTGRWRESLVRRARGRRRVEGLVDYEEFCGVAPAHTSASAGAGLTVQPRELAGAGLAEAELIDVREPFERRIVRIPGDRSIRLDDLLADPRLAGPGPVIVYCKSGVRSARAASALRQAGIAARSLDGGVLAWIDEVEPTAPRY